MARFNEYYGGPAPSVRSTGGLAATKLANRLKAIDPSLTVTLRNNRVNGAFTGCSGFVSNERGQYVYLNTEGRGQRCLYRTATGPRDFSGGSNRFAEPDGLAQAVVDLLTKS